MATQKWVERGGWQAWSQHNCCAATRGGERTCAQACGHPERVLDDICGRVMQRRPQPCEAVVLCYSGGRDRLEKLVRAAVVCRLPSEHAIVQDFFGDCDPPVTFVTCRSTPARQEGSGCRCGGRRCGRTADYRSECGMLCGSGVIGVPAYKRERNALNRCGSHARASEGSEGSDAGTISTDARANW